eukprot:SAG31_NODE_3029_length_4768_cov_4.130863_1_plen_114_part_00
MAKLSSSSPGVATMLVAQEQTEATTARAVSPPTDAVTNDATVVCGVTLYSITPSAHDVSSCNATQRPSALAGMTMKVTSKIVPTAFTLMVFKSDSCGRSRAAAAFSSECRGRL